MRGQQRVPRRLLPPIVDAVLANPVHRDTVRIYVVRTGANGQLPNACADCSADLCAVATTVHGAVSRAECAPDDLAAIDGRPIGRSDVAAFGGAVAGAVSRAESTSDDLAAIDGRPIGRSDVAAVGCSGSGAVSRAKSTPDVAAVGCSGSGAVSRAKSAPDFRTVALADGKPCAHDELATNRGTDDRTTEPHAIDSADAAPDASADDA